MDFSGAIAISSIAIAAIAGIGGWVATILGRKGAQEDHRRAEIDQAWDQLIELSEVRAVEIKRMAEEKVVMRAEYESRVERMQADYESRDKRRSTWCRNVVDTLVDALRECREHPATAEAATDQAIRLAISHQEHHADEDLGDERRSEGRS